MAKRNTRTVRANSSPLKVQKKINEDYVVLAKDYGKLGESIWRKPATKYVLGGIGLVVAAPYIMKLLKKIPAVEEFLASSTDAMEEIKDNFSMGSTLDSSGDENATH